MIRQDNSGIIAGINGYTRQNYRLNLDQQPHPRLDASFSAFRELEERAGSRERYERELSDIFALQDEITMKILGGLGEVTYGEQALLRQGSTKNLEAWGYYVKATAYFESGTKHDLARARELLKHASTLDPEYVSAWVGLALTHWFEARLGWSGSPSESIRQTSIIAQKVLSLDDTNPVVHGLMGCIHLYLREYEQAIKEAQRAVDLGPSLSSVHAIAGHIFRFSCKFEEAIAMIKKASATPPFATQVTDRA